MCKMAFIAFDTGITQERRRKVVRTVLKNSWDMGNRDGAGIVTWTPGAGEPVLVKELKIENLKWPDSYGDFVLVHARTATNTISIPNTHPMVGSGAYLVHNGLVHAYGGRAGILHSMRHTDNDSELILKSYLSSDRNLSKALDHIGGWANVMLWDQRRDVLSFFPDNAYFEVWRQDGVTIVAQKREQTNGVVVAGLGHPYEYAQLKENFVYEVHLDSAADIVAALRSAVSHKKKKTTAGGWGATYYVPVRTYNNGVSCTTSETRIGEQLEPKETKDVVQESANPTIPTANTVGGHFVNPHPKHDSYDWKQARLMNGGSLSASPTDICKHGMMLAECYRGCTVPHYILHRDDWEEEV